MNKELVKFNATDIMNMGKVFAESGMFIDTKSAAQAIVKIQAGQEIGIPPFAAMTGIHIIQGKPILGAGLIASIVKGSGKYDYKIIEHTEKNCIIDFYQGKDKIGTSSFSLEDARKAGTKNIEKFPKNMLFARAISNGVKWHCPDVFAGSVYTPEEFDMETKPEDIKHEVIEEAIQEDAIEGKYYAIIEQCRTKEDVDKKSIENKEAIQSIPALKKLFRERKTELPSATTTHPDGKPAPQRTLTGSVIDGSKTDF